MKHQIFKRNLFIVTVMVMVTVMLSTSIRPAQGKTVVDSMLGGTGQVNVQLMDKSGNPYTGVQAWMMDENGQMVVESAVSDEEGRIIISGLIENEAYSIRINGTEIINGLVDEEDWIGPIPMETSQKMDPSGDTIAEDLTEPEATDTDEETALEPDESEEKTETDETGEETETKEIGESGEEEETKETEESGEDAETKESDENSEIASGETEEKTDEKENNEEEQSESGESDKELDNGNTNANTKSEDSDSDSTGNDTAGASDAGTSTGEVSEQSGASDTSSEDNSSDIVEIAQSSLQVPLGAIKSLEYEYEDIEQDTETASNGFHQMDAECYFERIVYATANLEEELANAVKVHSFEELNAAVEAAQANEELNLFIAEDIVFYRSIEINKSLYLRLFSDGEKILTATTTRHFTSTASDITVSISMDNNIVLDGNGTGGGLSFGNGETGGLRLTLSGGVIQGCYADKGAGLFTSTASGSIKINRVTMRNCNAITYGGGVYAVVSSGGDVDITDSTFADCSAGLGAAVYSKAFTSSSVKISSGVIDNCYGTDASFSGNDGVFIQPFTGSRVEMIDVSVLR